MSNIEKHIKSCYCKKEKFKLRDLITFEKGKLHIHKFIPNDESELHALFEAKCIKCGEIMSHNW